MVSPAPRAPTRIEITWRAPMPRQPDDCALYDPGGYIYRVFRDGALTHSGSSGSDLAWTQAHALRIAAASGIIDPPIYV
jgi:hypothetical protein